MSVTAATMLPIRRLLASGNNAAAMSKTTFVRCMTASPLAGRKSLYDVLGVAPDSEQAEIKKAFISQSKKMHPDMNPDDVHAANESFRELASAYQILGNPQSRESYDNERLGHRGDPRDFDHEDLGRDGEMPRQRVYKTPKPVYNSYGAHVAKLLKMIAGSAPVIFVLAAIVWCMDNFYKTDMYSTNIYLQELEKSEKQDSEKRTNNHVCAQALCLHAGKPGRETQN